MATATPVIASQLRRQLDRVPRVRLAHLPTPLEDLASLSHLLGGPRILIKRDDCTGLAFGGNKTRHNEFILGEALARGADMLVWGAGVQSNNCRQTTAACAKLNLGCHLVLSRAAHDDDLQGNFLLDYVLGATYEIVGEALGPALDGRLSAAADRFRKAGRNVFAIHDACVKPRAAIGYVECMIELAEQADRLKIEPTAVYVCSAGATGAGLALGKAALGLDWQIKSVQPIAWPWNECEDVARIANETAELLDIPVRLIEADIDMTDAYIGAAYGVPTDAGMEAIALLARTEGILLDPSYTGKAMAALIDHVRQRRYSPDDVVVFIHTGGTPALFAYRDDLVQMIPPQTSPRGRSAVDP
jgi:1-aminocyclopropane-1-carboxylate deaminase/D-cysteine desulfhydrase-like pyridoxal-dependent ACC family enzyme